MQLLNKLDNPGCYIAYNVEKETAVLRSDASNSGEYPVPKDQLLTIFEHGWISRYSSEQGNHYYRLTDRGRRAIQGNEGNG